nr:hypothetical protein [Tanacetum cinerariifolium]GEZ63371.1 hypothetical protein [Tanacetum cinerariifolium]
KEGFPNVNLSYMGGFWVMIDLESISAKHKFMTHVGVSLWFSLISDVTHYFVDDERIVWVDIEGIPLHAWSHATFKRITAKWGLVDLKLDGYSFTWAHKSARKMSKLDRFLVSEGVFNLFPHLSAICLDRKLSDHRPILLRGLDIDYCAFPFRVFQSLFLKPDFDDMVEQTWSSMNINDSNHLIRFKKKLQSLKARIKEWNMQQKSATEVEMGELKKKVINKKRLSMTIRGIFIDGEWVSEPARVKAVFKSHFASRFRHNSSNRCRPSFEFPTQLTTDQVEDMERPLSKDEIRNAVWDCRANKSSGPDGFTFEFFRRYWRLIGVDLCEAVEWAFLFKWVWRFISKDDSMWYKVISAIHGPSLQSSSRSILNKSNRIEIIQELNSLKSKGIDIMSHCKKKVANGRHTSFWNERWYGDILFKEKFPRIYALENCKDVSVAVKFSSVGDIQNYRKEPRDGVEKQQLTEMNLIMNQICLATTNDRWSWDLNDEGSFVVKDMCNLIDDFMLPKEENKTRWIKYIPIKVNIFAWKVRLNRLPSRINLSRRGILLDSLDCPVCLDAPETFIIAYSDVKSLTVL